MTAELLQAASSRDPDKISELLKSGVNPNTQDKYGNTPLHLALHLSCSCDSCISNAESCCAVLLNTPGTDVNVQNELGETPLHLAAQYQLGKCVEDLIFKGADCYLRDKDGNPAMMLIASKTPGQMCKILDEALSIDDDLHKSESCVVRIDFRPLILQKKRIGTKAVTTSQEDDFCNEVKLLNSLLSSDLNAQEKLFRHPVVGIFLDQKWRRARTQLLATIIFRLAWLFFFTNYMYQVYLLNCPCHQYGKHANPIASSNASTMEQQRNCLEASKPTFAFILICMVTIIRLGYVILELCFSRKILSRDIFHIIIMCMVLGAFLPTFIRQKQTPGEQYQYAAFTLFVAWSMNMTLFGKFKKIGGYFEMFGHVLRRFLSIIPTFIFLYVGFAYALRFMFPTKPFFDSFGYSVVRVLIMTMGTDYYGMFVPDGNKEYQHQPVVGHLLYVAFVLVISIVLLNLVIGLTVSDIQNLQMEAEMKQISCQIAEMFNMEYFTHSKILPNTIRKLLRKPLSIVSKLEKGSANQLYLSFKINDLKDTTAPSELKDAAKPLVEKIHNERKAAVCKRRSYYAVDRSSSRNVSCKPFEHEIPSVRRRAYLCGC